MNANPILSGVEITRKVAESYMLPCGFVDASGIVHNSIVLREMCGHEDDELDNHDVLIGERISKILTACTEKLGTVTDKKLIEAAISDTLTSDQGLPLTAQDRIAALLFLRRVTLGDIYKFERRCPKCGELNKNKQLDLKTLTITPVKDPKKRRVQVKLPRSEKVAVLKVLAASGEQKVSNLKPTQKDLKSFAILSRLESLDGKLMGTSDTDLAAIKALPQADRGYLIQVYQMIEGNVDTDVQVVCKNALCGIEFEFPVDLGQLFFSSQVKPPVAGDLVWL